jgi:hypothetical protein
MREWSCRELLHSDTGSELTTADPSFGLTLLVESRHAFKQVAMVKNSPRICRRRSRATSIPSYLLRNLSMPSHIKVMILSRHLNDEDANPHAHFPAPYAATWCPARDQEA